MLLKAILVSCMKSITLSFIRNMIVRQRVITGNGITMLISSGQVKANMWRKVLPGHWIMP